MLPSPRVRPGSRLDLVREGPAIARRHPGVRVLLWRLVFRGIASEVRHRSRELLAVDLFSGLLDSGRRLLLFPASLLLELALGLLLLRSWSSSPAERMPRDASKV